MKNIISLILILFCFIPSFAKNEVTETDYRRSSIYSILVNNTEQKFADEIKEQFLNIPVSDKYNDHNLSVKVVNVEKKGNYHDSIEAFINNNQIGSRLVAKWFNRNILTGECSLELIKSRGLYDASLLDKELAKRSARGMAMLEDAGEELINNTFLLVNEINYVDKSKTSSAVGTGLRIFGALAGGIVGVDLSDLSDMAGDMVESIKGFKVKIRTSLYQLEWNEETANTFYKLYYSSVPNEEKKLAFEQNRNKFKMKYVGEIESSGSTTSFMGINENEPLLMVRKACQRALDENIADLSKKHEPFRIKAPIVSVDPTITVEIGLKEGITKDSKFEVLEAQEKNGHIEYKRVGVIKPIATKIWDNRFMALEEGAYGANFGATSFTKESGKDLYPGMLIRQIE